MVVSYTVIEDVFLTCFSLTFFCVAFFGSILSLEIFVI